ncbi:efflux transporter outer membrane subunit [Vibrio salinus]|uniref:efflux transporter outer membrane subunit n=1 Tax=Vibrio salinus TaxID=2899784 RepID=UPI001E4050AC|nr:TolC family protein [Vibrio salinus]MCE0496011.1 TolC family protein [Vibrio salinus]
MPITKSKLLSLSISCALLAGCGSLTHTTFSPPPVNVPSSWQQQQINESTSIDPWWLKFNDETLNSLITHVLKNNNDLALATLTLEKARLKAGLTATDRYPDISSETTGKKNKDLDSGATDNSFSTSLSISYELDLWGRVSSEIDAAKWTAVASEEDREATAQSLASTTASLYWQIGYLKDRLRLSSKSIDYAKQTLALTKNQYKSGAVTQLNVLEAQRSLAGQESSHSELVQQLHEAENSLAILLGKTPKPDLAKIDTLPDTNIPEIQAGVPADVLIRRPDVKSALYTMRAALATKDATLAAYFPTFSLTGSLGGSSTELHNLLSNPIGTLGANLVLPFLEWNQMKLNEKISDIDYQKAVVTYRKTLYEAFEDVDNALSAKTQYDYQAQKLKEQYNAASAAEKIYASQYRYGAVSIQDWLDAQETQRESEESLLKNRYNRFNIQATVYQALGGVDIATTIK